MSFKAINDIAKLNGIILILLVYSAYSQMTKNDPLLLLVAQQALVVKKAIAKVQKLQAKY